MIDIGIIVYRNYYLLDAQLEHWKNNIKGDYNLIIVDNTPAPERQYRKGVIPLDTDNSFDGISSGQAYDFVLSQAKTDIVGLTDPDHFWFNPNILSDVEDYFEKGNKCVGCAGFYPDFQSIIDTNFPGFAGHLAPVLWGMFIDRDLARSETFICEPPGVGKVTGWKVRQKIIDEKVPSVVFPGFFPFPEDNQICGFGTDEKPQSVHLLKGCSSRAHLMPSIVPKCLEYGLSRWK